MSARKAVKLAVDFLMTVALLVLSGYQFWGESAHEWVGTLMFILFIAHHILNIGWHKNIFKGKYTAMRIAMLCIDLLVLLAMLAQMYSGIVISRYAFDFLPINGGLAFARKLHILGAYWGFILMSLHIGLHWNTVMGVMKKSLHPKKTSKVGSNILTAAGLLIAGYGAYAFVKRDFFTYLFLKSEFVFLDYAEPILLFYIDYLAIMGLFIFAAHYGLKLFKSNRNRTK
ncbi:MAG: DUF4405 domain-containing protein [Acutalibacteraceae bacterium]